MTNRTSCLNFQIPELKLIEPYNVVSSTDVSLYREKRVSTVQALQTTPYKDNMERNPNPVSGTCEWFLGHKLFRQWCESPDSTMLWVSADPGSGKSVLAKHLVKAILPREHQASMITYFFFKDDTDGQRSAKSALKCILHQVFTKKKQLLSDKIMDRFKFGGGHDVNSLQDFWDIFVMALSQTLPEDGPRTVVCVLDALDECNSAEQDQLMTLLCDFYRSSTTSGFLNLKMLVTSRPIGTIRKGFDPLSRCGLSLIHLSGEDEEEIDKIKREIDLVIEAEVDNLQSYHQLDDRERNLLLSGLQKFENRTYLWVHLTLDVVKREFDNKMDLASITSTLPLSVDAAYERMLSTSPDKEMAKRLLHIILAAFRPMTVDEMNFALSLQPHHKAYDQVQLTPKDRFREDVRGLCGLLVTIVDSKVYLLHQTVREFLTRDNTVDSNSYQTTPDTAPVWKSSLRLQESHRVITDICVWYLSFPGLQIADSGTEDSDSNLETIFSPTSEARYEIYLFLKKHIFFEYSALNWVEHFIACGTVADVDSAKSLVSMNGPRDGRSPTWFDVFLSYDGFFTPPVGFTSLMIACYCGLDQVVIRILQEPSVDVDARDRKGEPALYWVVFMRGHGTPIGPPGNGSLTASVKVRYMVTVHLLISAGADVNAADHIGYTSLHLAFFRRDIDLIKLLIAAGADVNAVAECGDPLLIGQLLRMRFLLYCDPPLIDQNLELLQILLDEGADINAVDKEGNGPLAAAIGGATSSEAIQMLLDADADVNATNKYDSTPVAVAAEFDDLGTMRLLIDAGADVNIMDIRGGVPISIAIMRENLAIVRTLIDAGADVNKAERFAGALISTAIKTENLAVIKMLVDAGAVVGPAEEKAIVRLKKNRSGLIGYALWGVR